MTDIMIVKLICEGRKKINTRRTVDTGNHDSSQFAESWKAGIQLTPQYIFISVNFFPDHALPQPRVPISIN